MRARRRSLRILHTSDLHLGDIRSAESRRRHSRDCTCALDAVANTAAETAADALFIAGDLFDNARVSDRMLARTASKLAALPLQVVLLPGNHDHLAEDSPYRRAAWSDCAAGVHLITAEDGESRRFAELGLTVWGKPIRDHSPENSPLRGAPGRHARDWYVVVAHGYYIDPHEHRDGWARRSSPILAGELRGLDADYVALGHADRCRRIDANGPECWYSGAPLSGDWPGSVVLVTLDSDHGVLAAPVPVQAPAGCWADEGDTID